MLPQSLPFLPNSNIIMACHITGIYDVNRNITLQDDNYELVRSWAESITALNLHGLIFHNNFSNDTCKKYENKNITFLKIAYNPAYNPNVYRYLIYKDFIQQYADFIQNVFVTDISDVVLVKNPFVQPYFTQNPTAIFCGDEPKILDNDWMKAHAAHLRNKIADYAEYEHKFAKEMLLNCGLIGGCMPVFYDFIDKLSAIHQQFNQDNKTAFTGDMGAFNYLARTQFNSQLKHGAPINTIFKMYQNERKDCWFRHK